MVCVCTKNTCMQLPIIHSIVYMVHFFTLKYSSLALLILKNHWSLWESVYHVAWASQVALVVKNMPVNAGGTRDADSIPGSDRSRGGGHGNPLQYSCLENPLDRGEPGGLLSCCSCCVVAKLHRTLRDLVGCGLQPKLLPMDCSLQPQAAGNAEELNTI